MASRKEFQNLWDFSRSILIYKSRCLWNSKISVIISPTLNWVGGFVINKNYNSILYQCMRVSSGYHVKGIRKKEVNIMRNIINQTNGIILSINEEAQEMCLTQIRRSVAFSVALPLSEVDDLEKWLCSHMPENDPQGYKKIVEEVNEALKSDIPSDERRWSRFYKKHYAADGCEVHTTQYGAVHFDSTNLGEKLALGDISSICISDDEYVITIDANFVAEIRDLATSIKIFSVPLNTTDKDELAILGLFKEDCIGYLRTYASLHLDTVLDPAKRALIMDAKRYNFTKPTMRSLVEACSKYDGLGLVKTDYNNHAIGLMTNVLWTYCGDRFITMWAYDEFGVELERLAFTQG